MGRGWMIEVWFMWWDIYLTHTPQFTSIFHHQCIKIRGGLRWILLIKEMLSMYIHNTHQTRGSTATEKEVYAAIRADGLNWRSMEQLSHGTSLPIHHLWYMWVYPFYYVE